MTTEYEQAKAGSRAALHELGLSDADILSLRRECDELLAELVGQGFPRAAAGALTLLAIMGELSKSPAVIQAKLADILRQIGAGKPDSTPFEAKIAISILIESVAPDPGEMPG